jgi:hypothetical protein
LPSFLPCRIAPLHHVRQTEVSLYVNGQEYYNNLYIDTGKTCKDIGALNRQKGKVEDSDILKEYKKEYKKNIW